MKPPNLRLGRQIEIPVPHQPNSGIWVVATADNDFGSVVRTFFLSTSASVGKKVVNPQKALRLGGQIEIPVPHQPSSGIWHVATADTDFGSVVTNFSDPDPALLGKKCVNPQKTLR